MEEIASVYARALFEVAQDQGKLDDVRDQLEEFADALDSNQEMQVFFFSPYFSTPEKVTRKSLTEDDQKRLVEEALSELDFAALSGDRSSN